MNNTEYMVEANRLNETRLGRLVDAKLAEIGGETEWGYLNVVGLMWHVLDRDPSRLPHYQRKKRDRLLDLVIFASGCPPADILQRCLPRVEPPCLETSMERALRDYGEFGPQEMAAQFLENLMWSLVEECPDLLD